MTLPVPSPFALAMDVPSAPSLSELHVMLKSDSGPSGSDTSPSNTTLRPSSPELEDAGEVIEH